MLGNGIVIETERTLSASFASISSAFPRYNNTIAFRTLIMLIGS
jgi:hypothetical protein